MNICLLDVFLVGIVILFACLVRKTEGMKGAPITPKPSPPNTKILGILSVTTELAGIHTQLQTSDVMTDVSPNPSPISSYYKAGKYRNKVKQHDDLNLHLPS